MPIIFTAFKSGKRKPTALQMKQLRLKQQLEELERAREHRIYQTSDSIPPQASAGFPSQ